MNQQLYSRSIEIIRENQTKWGSYIASPSFPNYRYSWLRDGSYIAYAMDLAGQHDSAQAFYRWVGSAIDRYAPKVDVIADTLAKGNKIHPDQALHTRFTYDGLEEVEDKGWGNFQIDGYGSWLWGLAEHVRQTGQYGLLQELQTPIRTTVRFLQLTWQLPNYDCWEEFPEYLHTYTLASAYGGLQSLNSLANEGKFSLQGIDLSALSAEIGTFIKKHAIVNGKAIKSLLPPTENDPVRAIAASGVDASLLGLAIPYRVFEPTDPIMAATVNEIQEKLLHKNGGVYRYQKDVYYGGGEWILLTAWLGWHWAETGQKDKAGELLAWIEAQADEKLYLPEQVNKAVLFPDQYQPWLKKWGPVASPLLWSHAMYIILYQKLQEKN